MSIAQTPEPPYTAVIFTSLRTDGDDGYGVMSQRMVDLAAEQPGFLGVEAAREGVGSRSRIGWMTLRRRRGSG